MKAFLKCVINASVGVKKFIIEPLTPKVDQLFSHLNDPDARLYIPDLFYIECTNIVWIKTMHQGLRVVQTSRGKLLETCRGAGLFHQKRVCWRSGELQAGSQAGNF